MFDRIVNHFKYIFELYFAPITGIILGVRLQYRRIERKYRNKKLL